MLVASLLARDPAARPATATAVREQLAALVGGSDLDIRPPTGDIFVGAAFADTMAVTRGRADQTREAPTREAPTRVAFDPPASRRWPAIVVAFVGLAAVAALAIFYLSDRDPAAIPPADARAIPAIIVDAGAPAGPPSADAAPAGASAGAAPPIDAGAPRSRGRDRPRPDASVPATTPPPPPSPPDAAPAKKTDIDFILPGSK